MNENKRGNRKRGENKGILTRRIGARHSEALGRKAARKQRSTAEQLALLDERPGAAAKERARLGA